MFESVTRVPRMPSTTARCATLCSCRCQEAPKPIEPRSFIQIERSATFFFLSFSCGTMDVTLQVCFQHILASAFFVQYLTLPLHRAPFHPATNQHEHYNRLQSTPKTIPGRPNRPFRKVHKSCCGLRRHTVAYYLPLVRNQFTIVFDNGTPGAIAS